MNKLMSLLLLPCKRATELVEKRSVAGLTLMERFRLKLHTSMCHACSEYALQSQFLQKAIHNWFSEHEHIEEAKLPEPVKYTIIKEINDYKNNS